MAPKEDVMKINMGGLDRILRLILAVVIVVLILTKTLHGTLAVIMGVVAGIFVLTAAVGLCPLYIPFKLSTLKKKA